MRLSWLFWESGRWMIMFFFMDFVVCCFSCDEGYVVLLFFFFDVVFVVGVLYWKFVGCCGFLCLMIICVFNIGVMVFCLEKWLLWWGLVVVVIFLKICGSLLILKFGFILLGVFLCCFWLIFFVFSGCVLLSFLLVWLGVFVNWWGRMMFVSVCGRWGFVN